MSASHEQRLRVCTFRVGDERFGIAASAVVEGLRRCDVRAVPLAPDFIAGVLPYRGDVLTAVSLRVLLGLEPNKGQAGALVLRDETNGELFALLVDGLADVVLVEPADWEPNPPTLDAAHSAIFRGVYKQQDQPLLAQLDVARLQPSWLMSRNGERV